jgi:hypothetical protein
LRPGGTLRIAARGQARRQAARHQRAVGRIFLVGARLARIGTGQRGQAVEALLHLIAAASVPSAIALAMASSVSSWVSRGAERHHHVGACHQGAHGGLATP